MYDLSDKWPDKLSYIKLSVVINTFHSIPEDFKERFQMLERFTKVFTKVYEDLTCALKFL